MKWQPLLFAPVVTLASPVHATDYLTVAQAQAQMLPGVTLQKMPLQLTDAQRDVLLERSGVHEAFDESRIWRGGDGSWFVVDAVVGKHEKITYAVSLDAKGAVRDIEILQYHETYGYQVRDADWRRQFVGKTSHDALKLGDDIHNVSGATLSCKHVTQGVKRVLALYETVLAHHS
jgi:Na+-translocating ferredoxin:NAD+ oxidoreductase RnfG subunit